MAALATDTVIQIEFAGLLVIRHIQGMARETLGSVRGVSRAQAGGSKNFRNALRNRIVEHIPGPRMFVLEDPGAVLVLENFGLRKRSYRAVTSSSATGARSFVTGLCGRNRLQKTIFNRSLSAKRKNQNENRTEPDDASG